MSSPPGDTASRIADAIVIGGGIGGLAAARGLQTAGWSVKVLERAPRLDPLGAGITLWPNAVRALGALGIALPTAAGTGAGVIRTSSGRCLLRTRPEHQLARHGASMTAVHRADLQQALVSSLAPGTVVTGAEATAVEPRRDGTLVRYGGGAVHASLVVLADGLTSRTRYLVAGPRPRPRPAGYTAWRGVAPGGAARPAEGATETWGRGERFGVVPLADGRIYWYATATVEQGLRAADGEHAEVLRRFAAWHEPIPGIVRATDPATVLRHDVFDLRPHPTTYVRGRLVLLGDAAHAMTPDLGQGACQALEDAAVLAAVARPGADLHAALDRYDRLRRPRARRVAALSRRIGRVGQLHHRPAAAVRDLLLANLPSSLAERQQDAVLAWRPPGG